MNINRVLVALDQSNQAQTVFEEALKLAKDNSAALLIFQCIQDELNTYSIGLTEQFGMSPHLFEQAYQTRAAQVEQQVQNTISGLRSHQQVAADAGLIAEFDYKLGEPSHWICRMARQWDADVIVMGRRGRSGLTEVFLGSVSNYVLHHAPCSVFIVQPRLVAESLNHKVETAETSAIN